MATGVSYKSSLWPDSPAACRKSSLSTESRTIGATWSGVKDPACPIMRSIRRDSALKTVGWAAGER